MIRATHALFTVGVVLGASPSAMHAEPAATSTKPAAEPAFDRRADALLRRMSTDLGRMKQFRFDTEQVIEVVTEHGEKIHGLVESHVAIQRPNKLRADRMGPRGGGSIYYDGTNLTFYGRRDNLYASAKVPDRLDGMIDYARDQLSIDAPAADLLYGDPYAVLMEDAVSSRYLGKEVVGDRTCHHLAYRGHETDWQLWIEDGPRALPCRFVITSKRVKGSPEYTVSMSNWRTESAFPPDTFAFTPPRGAVKIAFVKLSDEARKHEQQLGRR